MAESPGAPDTVALLLEAGRVDDGLNALSRAVAGPAGQIAAAFAGVSRQSNVLFLDRSKDYDQRVSAQMVLARARLGELPREEAAVLARRLLDLEGAVNRAGSQNYGQRLREFIDAHPGTAAAALAEVDVLERSPAAPQARADALGAYALAHARTEAGAKARYLEGLQYQSNLGMGPGVPRGADPTDRILKLIDIVRDLESGAWPSCEWVDRAPSLVVGFYASQPTYSAANLDRTIAALQQFVTTHFVVADQQELGNGIGHLITTKLGDLFKMKNDADGIERTFDALEKAAKDPAAVRYMRALYYGSGLKGTAPAGERAGLIKKSNELLEQLTADPGYARKALATLAAQQFYERDYDTAVTTYGRFVRAYPESEWAWIAAMRIGQAQMEAGAAAPALTSFRRAASTFSPHPMAVVLGFEYAARANEALGDFEQALADHRRALDAWDDDYAQERADGRTYTFDTAHAPVGPPASSFEAPVRTADVVRNVLAARVAALSASLKLPGGAQLERGRSQLQQRQWDAARATLERVASTYPRTAAAAAAITLAHRARFEKALVLADVQNGARDEAAAIRELDDLARTPTDFPTVAATLARAAMLWKAGAAAEARASTAEALDAWRTHQPAPPAPTKGSLEEDVIAIRDVVFRPTGGGIYTTARGWNAFSWPPAPPSFLVMNPTLTVKSAGGDISQVNTFRPVPGLDHVLFLDAEQLQSLTAILNTLGGTARRAPAQIMETPNQPVGASISILALWNEFFPARPGHWGGWEFETYPRIGRIEFLDAARTKATAAVTIGYSGATVVLEKKDGAWTPTSLTNQWIT